MGVRRWLLGAGIVTALAALTFGAPARGTRDAEAAPPPGPHGAPEPDMLGVHWARGNAPPFGGGAAADPHLVYHGGGVIQGAGTVVRPIYWGTSWGAADSQAKISALATFYSGLNGSAYMNTNKGNDVSGTPPVSNGVTYAGSVTDLSAGPKRAPRTSDILAEVQRMVTAGQIAPVTNGYYPVYVDAKRGGAGYCAWHSWASVNYNGQSVQVQFGFFFNLDGDSGCDPNDPSNTYAQGIEALANVSGHEISEVHTDPRGSAWFDRSGYENADKCAWIFDGYVNLGGVQWKVQDNWTNSAYVTNQGKTKKGCVNGN